MLLFYSQVFLKPTVITPSKGSTRVSLSRSNSNVHSVATPGKGSPPLSSSRRNSNVSAKPISSSHVTPSHRVGGTPSPLRNCNSPKSRGKTTPRDQRSPSFGSPPLPPLINTPTSIASGERADSFPVLDDPSDSSLIQTLAPLSQLSLQGDEDDESKVLLTISSFSPCRPFLEKYLCEYSCIIQVIMHMRYQPQHAATPKVVTGPVTARYGGTPLLTSFPAPDQKSIPTISLSLSETQSTAPRLDAQPPQGAIQPTTPSLNSQKSRKKSNHRHFVLYISLA